MKVVTVKFGRGEVQGERLGIKSVFFWGFGFSVISRRIARRVSSLAGLYWTKRLAVVGGSCLQEGEGPVHRRRVLGGSM